MHHANLLIGSRTWARGYIPEDDLVVGPDVLFYEGERLSIEDVRALSYEVNMRPTAREYRTFVLMCDSLLHEAQNALLKILEEPNPQTVFYVVVPREDVLLPTLRSRLNLLDAERGELERSVFEVFIKAGYNDRLRLIAEKVAEGDTAWIEKLLRGLETHAHEKRDTSLMREALRTETYLSANGSSKKMLLEHLALTL
jgi:DNA polymerase-3 subunit delta'